MEIPAFFPHQTKIFFFQKRHQFSAPERVFFSAISGDFSIKK